MQFPNELRYTKSHEWARVEGGVCVVGVTDFAVEQLNKEIVNVDLPQVGAAVRQNEAFGILDAVKAAFDLNAPMSGLVAEINKALLDDPTLVAKSPYQDGWMIKIRIDKPAEAQNLLDTEGYRKVIESETKE